MELCPSLSEIVLGLTPGDQSHGRVSAAKAMKSQMRKLRLANYGAEILAHHVRSNRCPIDLREHVTRVLP